MSLDEYIRAHRNTRFRYGRHDCALFAAGWVREAIGLDLTLGITYRSRKDGFEQLRAAGYESHVHVTAAMLTEIVPLLARPGDLAVVEDALGIVLDERIAAPGPKGLMLGPLTSATRAFRVI